MSIKSSPSTQQSLTHAHDPPERRETKREALDQKLPVSLARILIIWGSFYRKWKSDVVQDFHSSSDSAPIAPRAGVFFLGEILDQRISSGRNRNDADDRNEAIKRNVVT